MNLHEYIGHKRNWEQLWADEQIAIWFEADGDRYVVYTAVDELMTKDCVRITPQAYEQDLTGAMKTWNNLINAHLYLPQHEEPADSPFLGR
jgi:hypothetical protein